MTAIQDKFEFLRTEVVDLGEPLTDEESLEDGGSRQAHEFGTLYFHPRVGEAFECHGLILETYVELGEQYSGLGYPLTDETDDSSVYDGRRNDFENGSILFDPDAGISVSYTEFSWANQVVLKIAESVEVTIDQGETMSMPELGIALGLPLTDPILASIVAFLPVVTIRRLFEDLNNATLAAMVGRPLGSATTWC
jgi:LGFP repeat